MLKSISALKYYALFGVSMVLILIYATQVNAYPYQMRIELAPAVCLLDKSQQKQRKCLEGYSFTILGLFPETKRNCVTPTSAKLSPLQAQAISRVMPNEFVRQQVWTQVGGCEQNNASQYFRKIQKFAQNLKIPSEIRATESKRVNYQQLNTQFTQVNPSMPIDGVNFVCEKKGRTTYLTQIQICYHENGQYRQCTMPEKSCPSDFIIQGSY